jgi:hypothetical protein
VPVLGVGGKEAFMHTAEPTRDLGDVADMAPPQQSCQPVDNSAHCRQMSRDAGHPLASDLASWMTPTQNVPTRLQEALGGQRGGSGVHINFSSILKAS